MTIDELLAIEEIKMLRSGYSAHLDSQNIDGLANLFCEDAVCAFPEAFGGDWVGRDTIRTNFAAVMSSIGEPFDAIHVTTNPWITFVGPDHAHGRWYLLDLLTRQRAGTGEMATPGGHDIPLLYIGIYEDDYRRVDGVWRFARIRLHVLWPERDFEALEQP